MRVLGDAVGRSLNLRHNVPSLASAGPHCPSRRASYRYMRCKGDISSTAAGRATAAAACNVAELHLGISKLVSAEELLHLLEGIDLTTLMAEAAALRDQGHPGVVTFSPKVFIPLTRLCRDSCSYCTFAQGPVSGRRAYMTLDEVLEVAHIGAQQGCTEALFTLGTRYHHSPQSILTPPRHR